MEFEVRVGGGIENCYASLPLLLIQTLQSSSPSGLLLPQSISLELRSTRNPDDLWFVSWSGSASSSTSIEVDQQFAECINLPDRTTVQVRVVPNLPKATLVTIEPHTEDDWEVLELNAEHAEEAFLKQVRVVREAMKFPLWLHGHAIVTFHVVSTFPKNAAVQLVQGTEVAVAPKRRKKKVESHGSNMEISDEVIPISRALLRIQDPDMRIIHKSEVKGVEVGVVLTFVAFIHPETAKDYSFESHQLVSLESRLPSREGVKNQKNHENEPLRKKSGPTTKETNSGLLTDKNSRQAIVHILISESIAKGHVMIARSLRLYLRARLHSWIYLKRCNTKLKQDVPSLLLSPCQFTTSGKNKALEKNGLDVLSSHANSKSKNMPLKAYSDMVDYSINDKIIDALSHKSPCNEIEETAHDPRQGLRYLLRAWFTAQIDVIGSDASASILGDETLLHFEVRSNRFETRGKLKVSSDDSNRKGDELSPVELFYVLSPEELKSDGKVSIYEVPFNKGDDGNRNLKSFEMLFGKLNLGTPVSFLTSEEKIFSKGYHMTTSSMNWMATAASDVTNRLTILLSPASGMLSSSYSLPLPGHILICGPPGSGKTLLARAIAKSLEEKEDLLAHIVFVCCSELAQEKATNICQSLSSYISEALDYAPSLVIFDDLDSIMSSSTDLEGSQPSTSVIALAEFLTDIIDEYEEKRKTSCGIGPIAFIASVQSLENIPQSLRSSGRFDFHFQLPAPAASERGTILKHEIQKRSLQCSDDILFDVASKCEGYDAYDLEILVDRTVHVAIGRYLPSLSASEKHNRPILLRDDFTKAMHEFLPVAMRDITKSALGDGRSGWDDVGGLTDIRNAITEMIELPSKFPDIFVHAPLRLRSNVLLYGPPGCGKTHIVGAAAAACSLRFISVKGPELLNKYIGASEQAVRDVFSKAASASPCLLFFDEFDSIAPKRGHDNTGVTDRVVNQFLTELDGVEVLTGVFVFAATSRPDLLDAALLRPGRLDRLLFCDFPSPPERLDILRVLSKKLPLASDVDLEAIAYMSEGFSGADLQALLSDAQLAAVHEFIENGDSNKPEKTPVINDSLLMSVASKAKPSVSDSEKQRLYGIYSQFLDSKRSIAAKSRDSKGKRATLA